MIKITSDWASQNPATEMALNIPDCPISQALQVFSIHQVAVRNAWWRNSVTIDSQKDLTKSNSTEASETTPQKNSLSVETSVHLLPLPELRKFHPSRKHLPSLTKENWTTIPQQMVARPPLCQAETRELAWVILRTWNEDDLGVRSSCETLCRSNILALDSLQSSRQHRPP